MQYSLLDNYFLKISWRQIYCNNLDLSGCHFWSI